MRLHVPLFVIAGGLAFAARFAPMAIAGDPQATNAAAPGIPVPAMPTISKSELDGGLVIEDMKIGDGPEVTPASIIVAHYQGTLKADPAAVFDSSFARGEPVGLPLSAVIPGWQRGIPGMRVGGIRRLTIPAALAYGDRSPSPAIPANSDLIFVVQVVDVLRVEELAVGDGDPISGRWVALAAFTIRDEHGKVIESHTASDPYLLVQNEYQPFSLGLEGMRRGGKRRLTVPAALAHSNPAFKSARPENVPLTIEIELLNVRNLPPDENAPNC